MSFADRLREARERRGLTLREISRETNVAVRMLEALERGEVGKLPGGIFSRAFVRAYARQVGLDPDETVEEFLAECADHPVDPTKSPAAGTPGDHARALAAEAGAAHRRVSWMQAVGAVAAGLFLFVLLVYGASQIFSGGDQAGAPRPQRPAPAESDEPEEPPVEQPVDVAPPPMAEGVTVQRVRSSLADEYLTIEIQPQAPCWVRLVVDGRVALARLLQPGERVVERAEEGIVLRVGDAAAFQYTLNNVPGRSLGTSGEVVTARIDKSNFDQFMVER